MKFTSPLGGMQQGGAPQASAENVTPWFCLRFMITSA